MRAFTANHVHRHSLFNCLHLLICERHNQCAHIRLQVRALSCSCREHQKHAPLKLVTTTDVRITTIPWDGNSVNTSIFKAIYWWSAIKVYNPTHRGSSMLIHSDLFSVHLELAQGHGLCDASMLMRAGSRSISLCQQFSALCHAVVRSVPNCPLGILDGSGPPKTNYVVESVKLHDNCQSAWSLKNNRSYKKSGQNVLFENFDKSWCNWFSRWLGISRFTVRMSDSLP